MWKVVYFPNTKEVEVLPGSWTEHVGDWRICYWPPIVKPSAFNKAVRQRIPKGDNWTIHAVMLVLGLGLEAKICGLGLASSRLGLGLGVTGLVNMNKATYAFSGGGGGEFRYSG
jgi:hypothetical protein